MEPFTMYSKRKNSSEQKEIDKYIKFFTLKSMQCVVQSRVGIKNKTKCNPLAKGLDWFNISLPEGDANNRLQNKIRELFNKRIPGLSQPVCIDVVLKTMEGCYTVLETWQITTDVSSKESNVKNHFSIYNRLGLLLRSVISSSRILPSYHLSRKTESDFKLFCKVHTEIYQLHNFELHNSINIGSVLTPSGKVSVNVLYRNKIWLSGSMHAYTYIIKDTETLFSLSAEKEKEKAFFQSVGADTLENEIALAASDFGQAPVTNILSPISSTSSNAPSVSKTNADPTDSTDKHMVFSGPSVGHVGELSRPVAAFVEPGEPIFDFDGFPSLDLPSLSSTPPFMSLLNDDETIKHNPKSEDTNVNARTDKSDGIDDTDKGIKAMQRTAEAVGFEDDFVLVELRPAFCSDDDSVGTLYRQCQSPVSLDMFSSLEREDKESDSIDLDTQLEKYRKELREFEDFFKIVH